MFNSLVLSVLFYSLDTVPDLKMLNDMLERFVVKCYKVILGIHEDVRIEEVKLVKILNVDTLKEMWRKRRMRAISHIARLPYMTTLLESPCLVTQ